MTNPTGEQIEIAFGDQRATVVQLGGGLRTYSIGSRMLLDGFDADAECTSGRGQVLIPWPNRIDGGNYEFDGQQHQVALNEPQRRNAIHGLVRNAPWAPARPETNRATMAYTLTPRPGYPFELALTIEYQLSSEGLSVATTATNRGSGRCPYGAGAHPYLTVGTDTVDRTILRAPGRTVWHANERGIPTTSESVVGTQYDFRSPRLIGNTKLDHAFCDLDRDSDGRARVSLTNPDTNVGLTLWMDDTYPYLMLFTGDPLVDVARRSIAVEPMTCPPNAFRTGDSLIILDPGQSLTTIWGITPAVG